MIKITIVAPCFNEQEVIRYFLVEYDKFKRQAANEYRCQLILVDDGSADNTRGEVAAATEELALDCVQLITLAGNFGHQSALVAGLMSAGHCDAIVTMDSDLEHPFEVIHSMIKKWSEGYLVVSTRRRPDARIPIQKRFFSWAFYRIIRWLTRVDITDGAADFRLVDFNLLVQCRQYLAGILSLRLFFAWLPVKKFIVDYQPDINTNRKTRFTFRKNAKFAIDSVIQFSEKPFQIYLAAGVGAVVLSLLYGCYVLQKVWSGQAVSGWASLVILIIMIGSLLIIGTGVLGLYIRRIQFSGSLPRYIELDGISLRSASGISQSNESP